MRRVRHSLQLRRRAASATPILFLVIGVAMLAVGIVIGQAMKRGEQSSESAADTGPVGKSTSTAGSVVQTKAPADFNAGDTIDPAVEARTDAARLAAERAARFADDESVDQDQDHELVDLGGTPPPIVFEPPVLDFGIVPPGRHVTGTVQIRNNGTEPLFIEASRASCTCTAVDMSNIWIQPGEAVPMDATFTQATLGEKNAAVRLKFRDYDAVVQLPIKATVALAVLSEPAYILATQSRDASTATTHGKLLVRSIDERPFRILAVDGRQPTYVDFNPAVDEPRHQYTLSWDISDIDPMRCIDAKGRPLHRWWVVETDHPDCPVFDVQVRHRCTVPEPRGRRNWIVSPPRILLGEMSPGESQEVEASLKWVPDSAHNEQVHAVLPESPHLDIELLKFIPGTDEDRFIMKITVKENAPEGLLYETARVHSQINKAPLLLTGRIAKN